MAVKTQQLRQLVARQKHLAVSPNDLIRKVASQMPANHSSAAVVLDDNNKLIGIITEQDIIERAVAVRQNVDETTVKEIMTADPVTIDIDAPLTKALQLLTTHGFRALPVLEGNTVVGIVDIRDLYQVLNQILEEEMSFKNAILNYAYGDSYGAGYRKK